MDLLVTAHAHQPADIHQWSENCAVDQLLVYLTVFIKGFSRKQNLVARILSRHLKDHPAKFNYWPRGVPTTFKKNTIYCTKC